MRYTYIKGIEGIDVFIFNVAGGPEITVSKIGAHFGIGYRYFTASGFYWGTNLIFGRYFSNNSQDVKEVVLDDSKLILDFELLKFGIAF
jgi:hypothetical protein